MPDFFDLPLEIRQMIYDFVLDFELSTPPTRKPKNRKTKVCHVSPFRNRGKPFLPVPVSTTPLFATNRQIDWELSASIARAKTMKTFKYKLDSMPAGMNHVHLTWLAVPAQTSHVAIFHVDFRISELCRSLFSRQQSGPMQPEWMVLWTQFLLETFLNRGTKDLFRPERKIGMLVLNLIFHSKIKDKLHDCGVNMELVMSDLEAALHEELTDRSSEWGKVELRFDGQERTFWELAR